MKKQKTPRRAALLAFALGGPGCFYVGWRTGVKATLAWLLVLSVLSVLVTTQLSPDAYPLAFLFLFLGLFHAGLAWLAYRSCKQTIAEAAKAKILAASNATQRAQPDASRRIKSLGRQMIALSTFVALGSLPSFLLPSFLDTSHPPVTADQLPPAVACILFPLSLWGLATGIGLLHAWRWSWFSMLILGGLIAAVIVAFFATPVVVPLLVLWGEEPWWKLLLGIVVAVLVVAVPIAIVVRWYIFFTREDAKAYFRRPSKSPAATA